jgi:soluble epoxide hydrolase/lipid-phosphate phosphatase
VVSRLALLHSDRFLGFAWLAVGFISPSPEFVLEELLATMKSLVGNEVFGYWTFLTQENAASVIEPNVRDQGPISWIRTLTLCRSIRS